MPKLRFVPPALLAALVLLPCRAVADVGDSESSYDPGRAQRRSDFALGLTLGVATGDVSGYPNEIGKIGVPEHEESTGFGFGPAGGFWVGGALRDWFVFGVGLSQWNVAGGGNRSQALIYLLHVETYPLFAQGGAFRDIGVFADFGASGRTIVRASDDERVADGGATSWAAIGAVYEGLRLGSHFSGGPTLALSHEFSESLDATLLLAGFRIVYYGGPG